MPGLTCSVENCAHNKNHLCCLPEIHVQGNLAQVTDQTFCADFRTRSPFNALTHEREQPHVEVICQAKDCLYHEDRCRCQADCVDICGNYDCKSCHHTACSTFRPR